MIRLSDEQWGALARELAERLEAHTPGWSDQRDHDPGVTLVQVFAFLAESLLFRASAIPEPAHTLLDHAFNRLATIRALTCCGTARAVRVRYFAGQLLTSDDLQAEQDYFRAKHRRHNLSLHGVGIVTGLRVSVESRSDSDESLVSVTPGVAIAPDGEELPV